MNDSVLKNKGEHPNKLNVLLFFLIILDLNADDVLDRKLQVNLEFKSFSPILS